MRSNKAQVENQLSGGQFAAFLTTSERRTVPAPKHVSRERLVGWRRQEVTVLCKGTAGMSRSHPCRPLMEWLRGRSCPRDRPLARLTPVSHTQPSHIGCLR